MNFANDPTLQEFGIAIGKEFEKVEARVIDPPNLSYSDKSIKTSKGKWYNSNFYETMHLENNWTVMSLDAHTLDRDLHDLVVKIQRAG